MRLPFLPLLLVVCALAGCGGPAGKTYTYQPLPTPGGRLCANQCREAQDRCQEACGLNERACTNGVQGQALHEYDQYTRQQFFSHHEITLHPRDFEHMQPCLDARDDCNALCESHHQLCYQNCGGEVTVTTPCQFLCF